MAITGDSFSRVRGSFSPTSLHSAAKIFVFSGTEKPACSAIHVAGFPTIFGLSLASAQFLPLALTPKQNSSSKAFSFLLTK